LKICKSKNPGSLTGHTLFAFAAMLMGFLIFSCF
jgi:hypothetical protein